MNPARRLALIALATAASAPALAAFAAPRLLWQKGGCTPACPVAGASSPVVTSTMRVVVAGDGVSVLNGTSGDTVRTWGRGGVRIRHSPVAADLRNDGAISVAVGDIGGDLRTHDLATGATWTAHLGPGPVRSVSAADFDGDGHAELVAGTYSPLASNTWVHLAGGQEWTGWPATAGSSQARPLGFLGPSLAAGDVDGDGRNDLVAPSVGPYIDLFFHDGTPMSANVLYGGRTWGQVPLWEDTLAERRGSGLCNGTRGESYRMDFGRGAAVIADMDRDGHPEVVVTGTMVSCADGGLAPKYTGVFVLAPDRTRYKSGFSDWAVGPRDLGAPLSTDSVVIEPPSSEPVVADLDGDGLKEILFAGFDGKVHAVSLDKTERPGWPYALNASGDTDFVFATPPVVADLDGDGTPEVVFGSWTRHGSKKSGNLHVVGHQGDLLAKVEIPSGAVADFHGAMASPTLGDVDGDGLLDIVLNTVDMGVVAWNVPNSSRAGVIWPTARGNDLRDGHVPVPQPVSTTPRAARSDRQILVVPRAGGSFRLGGASNGSARLVGLDGRLLEILPVVDGHCQVPPSSALRFLQRR